MGTTELPARGPAVVEVPFEFVQRSARSQIVLNGNAPKGSGPDPALTMAVARAHLWSEQPLSGKAKSVSELAQSSRRARYLARIVRLGFLAPDIVEAILDGKSPVGLTLEQLRKPVSLDWDQQRQLLGFATS